MGPLSLTRSLFLSRVLLSRAFPGILVFLATVAISGSAFAATLNVPGTYTTIQAAINAAVDGDIVLVDNGTYAENIDLLGKDITVRSVNGAALTTIDGTSSGPCVRIISGEDGALLEGFTLTGGSGVIGGPVAVGGGVLISGSSATVRNCLITGNANPFAFFYGAGVAISGVDTKAKIVGNKIYDNDAFAGAGIIVATSANASILRNEIYDNRATFGAGLDLNTDGEAIARFNHIYDNDATSAGGGIYAGSVTDSHCELVGNLIEKNTAADGAGLYLILCDEGRIERNTFARNTATDEGGGMYINDSPKVTIRNLMIYKNRADLGAGIYIERSANDLDYLTVVSNAAGTDGGGLYHDSLTSATASTTQYSIYWDNSPDQIDWASVAPTVDYCDIDGGLTIATNSINQDPLFDNELHLTAGSPCIDATVVTTTGVNDFDGQPRPLDGDDDGVAYSDMGADEYYVRFLRGDFNHDGTITSADPLDLLNYLLLSGTGPQCERAADADDDGNVNIADVTRLWDYINNGNNLPAPFPRCGVERTADTLTCANECP